MKKRLFLLLLTLILLIQFSACAALIEGYELNYRAHEVNPSLEQDGAEYIVVSTQEELARSILNMVDEQDESRLFRVLSLGRDAVEDAIREVSLRPLVAYAVYPIIPLILTESPGLLEMELSISYRKTAEQVANVRQVHTAAGASTLLGQMLREGGTYLALLCPVNIANVSFLETIVLDYYYRHPLDTVILPELAVSFYPSTGSGNLRVAAIELAFGVDHESFLQMRSDLRERAEEMVQEIPYDLSLAEQVIWISYALSNQTMRDYDEEIFSVSNTAYGALVMQLASSEGFARGLQALLSLLDIESFIVRGELEEEFHVWNLIYIEGYYYHVDISMLAELGAQETLFVPDEVMMFGNGYSWDLSEHPRAESVLRYADFAQ